METAKPILYNLQEVSGNVKKITNNVSEITGDISVIVKKGRISVEVIEKTANMGISKFNEMMKNMLKSKLKEESK